MNRPAVRLALAALFVTAGTVAPATTTLAADPPAPPPSAASTKVWRSRGTPAFYQALARAKAAKKQVLVAMPGGDGCCGDVPVDTGPIAEGLEKEPFLAFAAERETVLVEAPECAMIARAFSVERPGLLLVDGDGRWIAAVSLSPKGGATLAKDAMAILSPPGGAKPDDGSPIRVVLSGGAPSDAQVASLLALPGVLGAAREGGAVAVRGVREVVDPDALVAALASGASKPTSSHVLKRWRLAGFEKSMASLAMLRAALGVRGVLSVRPDRANKVVALLVDSTFDQAALDAAWKETYAEATPLP